MWGIDVWMANAGGMQSGAWVPTVYVYGDRATAERMGMDGVAGDRRKWRVSPRG